MEIVLNLFGILVALFVFYELWIFGHKGDWGYLVKEYKYEGLNPEFQIKDKTICTKENNKWVPLSTVDISFDNEGFIISNHVFLFKRLIPTIKIPWEKVKFLGEKRHLFFKGPHLVVSASPPVELILPKSSKEYIKNYVG